VPVLDPAGVDATGSRADDRHADAHRDADAGPTPTPTAITDGPVDAATIAAAKAAVRAAFPDAPAAAIERGVDQVASLWRRSDGDLAAFVTAQFAATPAARDALFTRLEERFEQIDGLMLELGRSLRWHADVDTGPMLAGRRAPVAVDPTAHVVDDLFASQGRRSWRCSTSR
jgi:hypothetical protein